MRTAVSFACFAAVVALQYAAAGEKSPPETAGCIRLVVTESGDGVRVKPVARSVEAPESGCVIRCDSLRITPAGLVCTNLVVESADFRQTAKEAFIRLPQKGPTLDVSGLVDSRLTFRVAGKARCTEEVEANLNTRPKPGPAAKPAGKVTLRVDVHPSSATVGQDIDFFVIVDNDGTEALRDLEVVCDFDAALNPVAASEKQAAASGSAQADKLVFPRRSVDPGRTVSIQIRCACVRESARACLRVRASTPDGATAEAQGHVTIAKPGTSDAKKSSDSRTVPSRKK